VVMMSGYTQGNVIPRGVSDGTTPFIQKPFETQQLMRTVHRVLEESQ
jgi:FixJ family two-component response regulator